MVVPRQKRDSQDHTFWLWVPYTHRPSSLDLPTFLHLSIALIYSPLLVDISESLTLWSLF